MLFKTKGIVLSFIKYKESSIIAKIYTEEFGLQSYIVNGVRSKNSKTRIALFQPLTFLEMVVYHKHSGGLQRISEIKCIYPFQSISIEIHKSAIALFIAEILSKTLKEDYPNPSLFNFLLDSIVMFDIESGNVKNFHLSFLIELSGYLGFLPSSSKDILHSGYVKSASIEEVNFIEQLLQQTNSTITANNSIRRNCLEYLLEFYSYHIENFGTVNSVKILKEVLSN